MIRPAVRIKAGCLTRSVQQQSCILLLLRCVVFWISHRFSFELKLVSAMYHAVEDGVGKRSVRDRLVPSLIYSDG